MLQVMRDKVMGWMGWVIIGLIIITFALFGLGSYLQDSTRIYAAKVNDIEISSRELQNAYQQQRAQLQGMLGENYNPDLVSDKLLRQRALENLISRALVMQGAAADGMVVSDMYLAAQIHAIPVFQENGVFSEERYKQLLRQKGESPASFETDTRNDLLADQLIRGISESDFITSGEIALAYALQQQQRDFSYAIIAAETFAADVVPGDAEMQDYYDQHADEFMVPERVRLEYLRLTSDILSTDIAVDEAELEAYYEQKKESLRVLEQRRASHILIKVAADAEDAVVDEARKKAGDLLARIRAGEDFAALAKQNSDDPASAENGGDLGFFAEDAMVPEFEAAVFSLDKGDVSEPVRTQFGFHLIKLVDIQGSEIPPLDQVRLELTAELQKQQVDDLFYEKLEQLTNLSYESPDSLDTVAEEMGLEVQTSDWLTAAGGPGVGAYPQVLAAVFDEDVLEAGNNSAPVEVAADDVIVARVAEREPAQRSPFETVKDEIFATLKKKQAAEKARLAGEVLLQKLSQGVSVEEMKGDDAPVFTQAKGIGRSATGYNPEVLRAAFGLTKPAAGEHVNHGMQLANGDYAVINLTLVRDGDPAKMQAEARQQIEQGYRNLRQAINFSMLVESLRARAEIIIPPPQEE